MKPSRDIPDDLLGVAETLESNRPQLSGLEADRIKRRAMAQGTTTATRTSTKGLFMRSRLAITSMLALGLLMTGSGAALGVSALTTTGQAAQAQYGKPAVNNPPANNPAANNPPQAQVLGEQGSGGGGQGSGGEVLGEQGSGGGGQGSGGDVLGEQGEGDVVGTAAAGNAPPQAVARQAAAQESRQLATGDGDDNEELPFTGFAAIPVLLIGTVLLAAGLLLRRDMGRSPAQS